MTIPTTNFIYNAEIIRVHDGDTVYCNVDVGFSTWRVVWIRIKDLYCAELNTKKGKEAFEAAQQILLPQKPVILESYMEKTKVKTPIMTFYRYVGSIWLPETGESYADIMTTKGFNGQGTGK